MSAPMRMRVVDPRLKSSTAIVATMVLGLAVSGCSTTSMFSGSDITGSTRTASAGNVSQPMPGQLAPAPQGPYVPPSDVGPRYPNNVAPNQVAAPVVQSAALPPAQPSATKGTTTMNPQTSVASAAPRPATQPVPNMATEPASVGGFTHVIESGESLYAIARKYSVTTDSIVHANGLESPDKIFVGQRLTIPGKQGNAPKPVQTASAEPKQAEPAKQAAPQPKPAETDPVKTASVSPAPAPAQQPVSSAPAASSADNFRWPVQGRLIVDFKSSKGTGINIEAPEGAMIRAAENGTVIYTGNTVEGYGNLVLIRHANGFVSAYAHLKDIAVQKGQAVNRGDNIGSAGMTGSVTRPQLHFELRKGATPVDPVPLLAG